MSNQPKQRIQVPDSLRDILLEFSIAYLLEQPGDVVDYAVEFFTKLQENRKSKISHDDVPPSPDESIMSLDEGTYIYVYFIQKIIIFFIVHFMSRLNSIELSQIEPSQAKSSQVKSDRQSYYYLK